MKRAIALFIVWLIATVSVPYSHIFSLAINGFAAPAYSGLAWAQKTYQLCGSPFADCVESGTGTECLPELYSDSQCNNPVSGTPPPLQNVDPLPRSNPDNIYMCKDQLTETSYRISCKEGKLCGVKPKEYRDYGRGDLALLTCLDDIWSEALQKKQEGHTVLPEPLQSQPSYTITLLDPQACSDACEATNFGATTIGIYGECSETAPLQATGVVVRQLSVACPKVGGRTQKCYCTAINTQQVAANIQTPRSGTSSLPGTGGLVDDPDKIDEPKRFAANDVDCDVPTRVTINATISPNVAPVGGTVTVSGGVAKFSDACRGVQYQCRSQYNIGCRVSQGFFSTCVNYNSCRGSDKIILREGSQCSTNWFNILSLVIILTSVANIFITLPQATLNKITTAQTAFRAAIPLLQKTEQVYVPGSCNAICGRDEGKTAVAAAPACRGYPIGQEETHYRCREASCGGFANKEVFLEVRNAANTVIISDSTETDVLGAYSFTFAAPGPAGSYRIIVFTEDPQVIVEIVDATLTTSSSS